MVRNLIALLVLIVAPMQLRGQEELWLSDPEQAMVIAQQTNRLVLMHFWNEQCAPCRKLESFVFPDGRVQEALRQHYVAVKINTTEHPEWARRYRIDRIPQDLVVRADGRIVSQRISPSNSRGYVSMLESVAQEARRDTAGAELAVARAIAYNDPRELHPTRSADIVSGPIPGAELPGRAARVRLASGPAGDAEALAAAGAAMAGIEPPPRDAAARLAAATAAAAEANLAAADQAAAKLADQARQTVEPVAMQVVGNPFVNAALARSSTLNALSGGGAFRPQDAASPAVVSASSAGVAAAETRSAPTAGSNGQVTIAAASPATPGPANEAISEADSVPANLPPLGLEGFCPVSLVTSRAWKKGDDRFGCLHRGKLYLFVDAESRDRFLQEPDRYAPMLGGYDPVAFLERRELIEGRREFGVFVDDRIVLFADEAALLRFESNSQPYLAAVEEANQVAPANR